MQKVSVVEIVVIPKTVAQAGRSTIYSRPAQSEVRVEPIIEEVVEVEMEDDVGDDMEQVGCIEQILELVVWEAVGR